LNINAINKKQRPVLSFEVFPPKRTEGFEDLFNTISRLKKADPSFISVTYGAGGSKKDITIEIASRIKNDFGIEPLAHLTCVGSDASDLKDILDEMRTSGIDNILALRGDVPIGMSHNQAFSSFKHATDLIDFISGYGGFYTAAAAYPEGHPQSQSLNEDIDYLKIKQDKGVLRFNTQLCFDIPAVLSYIETARQAGVTVPFSVGIMPILNPQQILRMVTLAGASIPARLSKLFALYGKDEETFMKYGLDYAKEQVRTLIDAKVDGIHLYSMNKPDASLEILKDTGLI